MPKTFSINTKGGLRILASVKEKETIKRKALEALYVIRQVMTERVVTDDGVSCVEKDIPEAASRVSIPADLASALWKQYLFIDRENRNAGSA